MIIDQNKFATFWNGKCKNKDWKNAEIMNERICLRSTCNFQNKESLKQQNINTERYGSYIISYLAPKIWNLVTLLTTLSKKV